MGFFPLIVLEAIPSHAFSSYKHDDEDSSQNISSLEENSLLWSTFYWFHVKLFKWKKKYDSLKAGKNSIPPYHHNP